MASIARVMTLAKKASRWWNVHMAKEEVEQCTSLVLDAKSGTLLDWYYIRSAICMGVNWSKGKGRIGHG